MTISIKLFKNPTNNKCSFVERLVTLYVFFSLHIYILINIGPRMCHSNQIHTKKVTHFPQNDHVYSVTGVSYFPFSLEF